MFCWCQKALHWIKLQFISDCYDQPNHTRKCNKQWTQLKSQIKVINILYCIEHLITHQIDILFKPCMATTFERKWYRKYSHSKIAIKSLISNKVKWLLKLSSSLQLMLDWWHLWPLITWNHLPADGSHVCVILLCLQCYITV